VLPYSENPDRGTNNEGLGCYCPQNTEQEAHGDETRSSNALIVPLQNPGVALRGSLFRRARRRVWVFV